MSLNDLTQNAVDKIDDILDRTFEKTSNAGPKLKDGVFKAAKISKHSVLRVKDGIMDVFDRIRGKKVKCKVIEKNKLDAL